MMTSKCARRAAAVALLALSAASLTCLGQGVPGARNARAGAAADAPKYKGIFEPMNYPDDLTFLDVFFVNDRVGWIAGHGSGGMILHTDDGGQHWAVQVGDPKSNDPEINGLRFLDATHGWALQAGKLLRTTDGKTWQSIGTYQNPFGQLVFTTPRDGFEAYGYFTGSTIQATHDGGRTWKPVYECATTLQVNGLTQNTKCMIFDMQFPTTRVGYAVGGAYNGGFGVIAKTVDGGTTWNIIFANVEIDTGWHVVFQDENHGVVVTKKHVLVTADGGRSWQGGNGAPNGALKFADPSVGWACYEYTCSTSVDGGQNWVAHDIKLPTDLLGFSLPRRDRAWLVGQHGLIYHYRIVPANYTAPGIVNAPLMPAYGGALRVHLDQMTSQISTLQARLNAAAGLTGSAGATGAAAPAGSTGPAPAASANNSFVNMAASPGVSTASPTSGASPTFGSSTSAPDAGASALGSGAPPDTNFSQDTSVASSAPVQSCCAAQVTDLQSSVATLGQQVPAFSGQFRNLNLLFVGLNMFQDLATKAQAINQSFLALKQAPNLQAALAAAQTLSGQLAGATQAIDSDFESLSSGPAAPADSFSNMGGNAAPGANPASSNGTPAGTSNPASDAVNSTVNQATQKAKDALKKMIPF